jgi:hypothetical protein
VGLIGLCGPFFLWIIRMKKTYYFPHDFNSRGDEKIIKMIKTLGWESYGLFWAIIEKLHEAGGYLVDDPESIAFDLRTQCERIDKILHNFGLFACKSGKIASPRALKNINLIKSKSEKARDSAHQRWNANAMQPQCERNARNEMKGEERKLKIISNISIPPDLKPNESEIMDWLKYKQQKGQSYKTRGLEALWRSIRAIPEHLRRSSIDNSMANNWSGLFQKNENKMIQETKKSDIPNVTNEMLENL